MADFEPLLFKEAIHFFNAKVQLPSSGWTDIWQEQHSHAFVVAGATKDALVSDFYNALKEAQAKGTGYAAFAAQFEEIVTRHGWSYNGSAGWRSKTIYDTNITQAYNAGRWQQMMAGKEFRPFGRYRHTSIEHPRLEHKSWDGLILSLDDPWWNTHMPQNGWRCKCRVDSLSRSEAKREWEKAGKTGADVAPEIVWVEKRVGTKGAHPRTVLTPEGIDAGFAHNPGRSWLEPHTPKPITGYDPAFKERDKPYPKAVKPLPVRPPTSFPSSALYPVGVNPEKAVSEFLDTFNASLDRGSVFIDVTGTPIAISKALFIKGADKLGDNFKWLTEPDKANRLRYINLMAQAIIDPDEIWWYWEKDAGEQGAWRLKRRYLKSFEIDESGKKKFAIAGFEWSNKEWNGATVFHSSRESFFEGRRIGRLIYKK